MNWRKLYFGRVPVKDMRLYTPEEDWQVVRRSMKGMSLEFKYNTLSEWLITNNYSYASKIQVTNYITALSRGGLIKPKDYRDII